MNGGFAFAVFINLEKYFDFIWHNRKLLNYSGNWLIKAERSFRMTNWRCANCSLWNMQTIDNCRRCNSSKPVLMQPAYASPYQQMQSHAMPFQTFPHERVNRAGKTCPRCGITNSTSTLDGMGIVLVVILLITILGVVLIPFLPKTWFCRYCCYRW